MVDDVDNVLSYILCWSNGAEASVEPFRDPYPQPEADFVIESLNDDCCPPLFDAQSLSGFSGDWTGLKMTDHTVYANRANRIVSLAISQSQQRASCGLLGTNANYVRVKNLLTTTVGVLVVIIVNFYSVTKHLPLFKQIHCFVQQIISLLKFNSISLKSLPRKSETQFFTVAQFNRCLRCYYYCYYLFNFCTSIEWIWRYKSGY